MPDIQISEDEISRRKRRRYFFWGGGTLLIAVAIGVAVALMPSGPAVSANDLLIGSVHQGDFVVRVQAPGTLRPHERRWVTSAVGGTVEVLDVHPGSSIKRGEVLAVLVNPHLYTAELQARSKLATARADKAAVQAELRNQLLSLQAKLASAKAAADVAGLKLKVDKGLLDEHVIAVLRYETDVSKAQDSKIQAGLIQQRIQAFRGDMQAQIQSKAAEVAAAQAQLKEAEENVDGLKLRAGMSGVVQEVAIHAGQQIGPGSSVARIANVDDLRAVLNVSPDEAGEVTAGQSVRVTLNNGGTESIAGVVKRVSPNVVDGDVPVTVRLTGALPSGARPNFAVLGIITVTTIPNALYVDRPVGAQAREVSTVYRIVDNGHAAVPVHVRFGVASTTTIQVRSGLRLGDRIITSDTQRLAGDDRVEIR